MRDRGCPDGADKCLHFGESTPCPALLPGALGARRSGYWSPHSSASSSPSSLGAASLRSPSGGSSTLTVAGRPLTPSAASERRLISVRMGFPALSRGTGEIAPAAS